MKDATEADGVGFTALTWETVYSALSKFADECGHSKTLLEFMEDQGLNAGPPITADAAQAFVAGYPLLSRFERYMKAIAKRDWEFMPEPLRGDEYRRVKQNYGRFAVEFPIVNDIFVTAGILYDNYDHQVPFENNSSRGLDVFLRLESHPKMAGRRSIIDAVKPRVAEMIAEGGVVRVDGDGITGNRHTIVIAQRSLSEFLGFATEAEQQDAIYSQIANWSKALFRDENVFDVISNA